MVIKIVSGTPQKLYSEVSAIVEKCFEGIWTAEDLQQLVDIPHESKIFMVAYDDENPVGYAYIVADYIDAVDTKIATIQEIGVLPEFRDSEIVGDFIKQAIKFSKSNKAELLEQVISTIDQWLIPSLLQQNLKPSEIKADREITNTNEAKLIVENLKKNAKLNVIMNQLFFEVNNELDTQIIESDDELNSVTREGLIAFGSIISIDKAEDLDNTLNELNSLEIEWDEIGITFDYML